MMKKKYFKCRDGSLYTKYTKEEIYNLIDPYNFNTIEPFLQEMDYPAIYDEYLLLLKHNQDKPTRALLKYVNVMNLKAYHVWGYWDWLNYH